MSGIIGHTGANSGIVDAHPSGTIFYTDSVEYTSTQATQNFSHNGASYESDNLKIDVPAATVAKASKIYVAISNTIFMNANIRTNDFFIYFEYNILRTEPGADVKIACYDRCGMGMDTNDISGATGTSEGTISGFDKNLGTGIHTYKLQVAKLASQTVYGGDTCAVYGHSGSKVSIQVMAIAR